MFNFTSTTISRDWTPYRALRREENISLVDAQRLATAIQRMNLPTPTLWLGTETDPMVFSPGDFAAENGPIGDPLNWKFSWQVAQSAPTEDRDRGKEEYAAADFARSLQACTLGNEGELGAFAAKVLNAQQDNRTHLTAADGLLELMKKNPEALIAGLREIIRKAAA